jgi:hypothetical protein
MSKDIDFQIEFIQLKPVQESYAKAVLDAAEVALVKRETVRGTYLHEGRVFYFEISPHQLFPRLDQAWDKFLKSDEDSNEDDIARA